MYTECRILFYGKVPVLKTDIDMHGQILETSDA